MGGVVDAYPTYVGLGAYKAGTTLLHSWLEDHPDVCVPSNMKEVDFFTEYYDRGLDWYRSLFDSSSQASGEFSVTYLYSEPAIERIAKDLPWAKCIVILRDPIERLASEYRHFTRFTPFDGPIGAYAATHPGSVERGRYGAQLASVLERFPRDQVKVLVLEQVVAKPRASAMELYEFLGVRPQHVPDTLHTRVNVAADARLGRLDRLARRTQRFAKRRDAKWLSRLGRSAPVRRVRALNARPRPTGQAVIDAEATARLRNLYAEDVAAASRLLGTDLAAWWGWRPSEGVGGPE